MQIWVLTVESWELLNLTLLDYSKKPTIWTWETKTISDCKIPNMQVGEDSSWFSIHWTAGTVLENLMKSLGKKGLYIYTYFFL